MAQKRKLRRAHPLTETTFDFERDFAGSLRCIPMSVRLKLDRLGIKLTLRQWSRFGKGHQQWLFDERCHTPDEIASARATLVAIVEALPGETVKEIEVEPNPIWLDDDVPQEVVAQTRKLGLGPISKSQWLDLAELQRFALVKLAREGHENLNFLPAMREFGLV